MDDAYTIQNNQGVRYGPMPLLEILQYISERRITPLTMVLKTPEERWQMAATWSELKDALLQAFPEHANLISYRGKFRSGVFASKPLVQPFVEALKPNPLASPSPTHPLPTAPGTKSSGAEEPVPTRDTYRYRGADGVEVGPLGYQELRSSIQEQRLKGTTMVWTSATDKWHLAASLPEVRVLIRKFNPGQDGILDRIRAMRKSTVDKRRASTTHFKVKKPFWAKFFFGRKPL
jgi:hypothetical protein